MRLNTVYSLPKAHQGLKNKHMCRSFVASGVSETDSSLYKYVILLLCFIVALQMEDLCCACWRRPKAVCVILHSISHYIDMLHMQCIC